MQQQNIAAWLDALRALDCDPQKAGSGYKAKCPAHDDHNPSLSLYLGKDGEWWPTCHTGCDWREIKKVLGLWNEPQSKGPGKSEIPDRDPDAVYDYQRVDGSISFQVLRWNATDVAKKFIRPRLPDGRMRLPKGKSVLYNRVDLKYRADAVVLFVEGEKTAEVAKRIFPDHVCTCAVGGAGKAKYSDWRPLSARKVVVWPDADPTGISYAREVRKLLLEQEATVQVVQVRGKHLSQKWDLADPLNAEAIEAGVTLEGLIRNFIPDSELDELDAEEIDVATGGKNVFHDANASSVAEAMETLGLGIKSNTRDLTVAYKMPDGTWNISGSAVIRNEIRERCLLNGTSEGYRPFKMSDSDWKVARDTLAQRNSYDPFLEMLEALPEPPDQDQYYSPTLLNSHFGVLHEEEQPLAAWAIRYVIIGMIQRAHSPGCQLDELPILIAPQGAGKSSFLESFFAPEYRDLFREGLDLAATDKVKVESMQGSALVELAEMSGITKARLDHLKAFLTRKNDGNVRLTYRTDPFPIYRKCIFVGTANQDLKLPDDPTGQRRFVPITLGKPDEPIEPLMNELRDGLLAEGLARYRAGERANLPRELKDVAAKAAARYRHRNQYQEDNIANLVNNYDDCKDGLSLRQIANRLDLGDRSRNGKELPASLKNEGWFEKRVRKDGTRGRFWFPPAEVEQTELA